MPPYGQCFSCRIGRGAGYVLLAMAASLSIGVLVFREGLASVRVLLA